VIRTKSSAPGIEDVKSYRSASLHNAVPTMVSTSTQRRALIDHCRTVQEALVEDVRPISEDLIGIDAVI
jgi:hypothetical protein